MHHGIQPLWKSADEIAQANGSHGLGHLVGSLEVGKQADLLVLDVDDYRMLPYRYGTNMVRQVIKRGRMLP